MTDPVAASAVAAVAAPGHTVGDPVAIHDRAGATVAWFVPYASGDRLAGFAVVGVGLELRRTSWLPDRSGSGADLPSLADWIDPVVVARRAASVLAPGETVGVPVLSWDGAPDRLAWAVPVRGPFGDGVVFVAGTATWRAAPGGDA